MTKLTDLKKRWLDDKRPFWGNNDTISKTKIFLYFYIFILKQKLEIIDNNPILKKFLPDKAISNYVQENIISKKEELNSLLFTYEDTMIYTKIDNYNVGLLHSIIISLVQLLEKLNSQSNRVSLIKKIVTAVLGRFGGAAAMIAINTALSLKKHKQPIIDKLITNNIKLLNDLNTCLPTSGGARQFIGEMWNEANPWSKKKRKYFPNKIEDKKEEEEDMVYTPDDNRAAVEVDTPDDNRTAAEVDTPDDNRAAAEVDTPDGNSCSQMVRDLFLIKDIGEFINNVLNRLDIDNVDMSVAGGKKRTRKHKKPKSTRRKKPKKKPRRKTCNKGAKYKRGRCKTRKKN